MRWCLALVFGVLGTPADAHPFQDGLAGHRLRLTVRADSIEADLLVEEPIPWVLRDLRTFLAGVEAPDAEDQERYTVQRLAEFQSGLQLHVDGERRPWTAVPVEGANGVVDQEFVVYSLKLRAPLDPDRSDQAIHVLDVNHPDMKVARFVEVWGAWDSDLRGCSLWSEGEGDDSGRWTFARRTAEVRLTRRTNGWLFGLWARARMQMGQGSAAPVRVGPNGMVFENDHYRGISWGVGAVASGLVALVLIGWNRRRRRRRHL